jgi:hypothetical protein
LNRREIHVVRKIDGARERAAAAASRRYRDRALDLIGSAMCDVIDPDDRKTFARELCTAASMNAAQACGPSATAVHLSSLSGQAFTAAEQILTRQKRRGR